MRNRTSFAHRTQILAGVAALGVGLVAGIVGASPTTGTRTPERADTSVPAAEAPQDTQVHCHGATSRLSIDFGVARSVRGPAGEQLSLQIAVQSRFDGPASVAYAVEWTDDVGTEIKAPELPPVVQIGAGQSLSVERLTPLGLADGFYQLRVKAIGLGSGAETVGAENVFYFKLAGGSVVPLDDEEWHEFSRANIGVRS